MEVPGINVEEFKHIGPLTDKKLKVVVELDHDRLRISCDGPCDVDKWRGAYVTHWRRKMKKQLQEGILE